MKKIFGYGSIAHPQTPLSVLQTSNELTMSLSVATLAKMHVHDILEHMEEIGMDMYDRYHTIKMVHDIWTDVKNTEQEIEYSCYSEGDAGFTASKFSELYMLMNNYLMAHIKGEFYDHYDNEFVNYEPIIEIPTAPSMEAVFARPTTPPMEPSAPPMDMVVC